MASSGSPGRAGSTGGSIRGSGRCGSSGRREEQGPYGITTTPSGAVYYASLAGSYLGRIDVARSTVRVLQPPTRDQGARRAWSDSKGRIWVSEWNAGKVAVYAPSTGRWREWRLPGATPMPYAVYVDETG